MELQRLISHFRDQVSDKAAPYLWDDDEALLFAIDAQDMLVRKIGGISDMTVPAASDPDSLRLHDLVLTANEPYTAFSPYILRVRSARLVTAKRNVNIIAEGDVAMQRTNDYGFVWTQVLDDDEVGQVDAGVIGIIDGQLRWFKVPEENDSCRLHIYRLPYPRIVQQEDDLEIDEQHHLHLTMWMKYLAYSKEDAETYDKTLAETNRRAFLAYCDTARDEKDRQRFKPRIVQYGGL